MPRKYPIPQYINVIEDDPIVDIEWIENRCLESFPCQHDIRYITKSGTSHVGRMNGVEIYNLFQKLGKSCPVHFMEYAPINPEAEKYWIS
ncbi:hypothetical protein LCGC14_2896000 [marine sediment metagenome]|uniref:Uncharacterized protein n=1 Tax=marine sediment metagenome TaxID=412755 RepID=A0A0F8XVT4_9ZZZZ